MVGFALEIRFAQQVIKPIRQKIPDGDGGDIFKMAVRLGVLEREILPPNHRIKVN